MKSRAGTCLPPGVEAAGELGDAIGLLRLKTAPTLHIFCSVLGLFAVAFMLFG